MRTINNVPLNYLKVRRFTTYRNDRRCFELYDTRTNECASFPGTRKDLENALKTYAKEDI